MEFHVDVRQDAAVYGALLTVYEMLTGKSGEQAVMVQEHVHVTDVSTLNHQAEEHTHRKELQHPQGAHTECVRLAFIDV